MEGSRRVYDRFKRWVDFLFLHPLKGAEIEKETLRLRGVIRSSHTRGPRISLNEREKAELKGILESIGILVEG